MPEQVFYVTCRKITYPCVAVLATSEEEALQRVRERRGIIYSGDIEDLGILWEYRPDTVLEPIEVPWEMALEDAEDWFLRALREENRRA